MSLLSRETRHPQNTSRWGPLWVALGASLWGTETLWRVFLNKEFSSDVLVFYEHLYCLLITLPLLWFFRQHLRGVSRTTWLYMLGSGLIGSALGTYFFTASLRTVNLTVANVLLNIQPVFSAFFAHWLLREGFGKGFFLWSAVAISAGILLSLEEFSLAGLMMEGQLWMVFATALCWSFATVAGRGINIGMSYRVATPLRFTIGLVGMSALVALEGHFNARDLNFDTFDQWRTHQDFFMLAFFAGVIPLYLYFKGLASTRATVASFLEMFQIVVALVITWGFFGDALAIHQILGGILLLIAVYRINRIQCHVSES